MDSMNYATHWNKSEEKIFLANFAQKWRNVSVLTQKSDSTAKRIRNVANESFVNGNFAKSLRLYNNAVCKAENGSEILGLCYANRAACFLKLKQYELCLADIELAKANKYPAQLMPKLEKRKTECLHLLAANGDANSQREEPKLSFDADPKIPCFASGIEVKYSEKYGNHIITKRHLDVGQTVIVERAWTYFNTGFHFCGNCYRRDANLIPCNNCVTVMYCCTECRDASNPFHEISCGIEIMCDADKQDLVLKSIIIAIKTFATVESLMDAVASFSAQSNNAIAFEDPAEREYQQFYKLRTNAEALSKRAKLKRKREAMEVSEVLIQHSCIREMFPPGVKRKFLAKLAVHHTHIIASNSYMASHGIRCRPEDVLGIERRKTDTSLGYGIAPYSSQMNHSCAPNICRIFINDLVVFKVIRPIKSGEQLFISYLDPRHLIQPRIKRAAILVNEYNFVCDCISCESDPPSHKETDHSDREDLVCRLLAILDGVPESIVTKLLPVTQEETRMFEKAAVNFLRQSDHLRPTMETMKIQFLLTQIWYLLMR